MYFFLPLCLCLWRFEFSFFSFEICRKGGEKWSKSKDGMLTEVITLAFRPIPFLLLLLSSFFLGGNRLDFHLMCMSVYTLHRSNSRIWEGVGGGSFKIEANMDPPSFQVIRTSFLLFFRIFYPHSDYLENMSDWKNSVTQYKICYICTTSL